MGKNIVPDELGLPLNMAGGRGTRIPDLRLLLAVHGARQQTGETVRVVREGSQLIAIGDEPARLTLIFGAPPVNPVVRRKASGAFNARVAAHMTVNSMMKDPFTLAVSQGENL